MKIDPISFKDFGYNGRLISPEHHVVIQKLVQLGGIPSYNFHTDIRRLDEAETAVLKKSEEEKAMLEETLEDGVSQTPSTDVLPLYDASQYLSDLSRYFTLGY